MQRDFGPTPCAGVAARKHHSRPLAPEANIHSLGESERSKGQRRRQQKAHILCWQQPESVQQAEGERRADAPKCVRQGGPHLELVRWLGYLCISSRIAKAIAVSTRFRAERFRSLVLAVFRFIRC